MPATAGRSMRARAHACGQYTRPLSPFRRAVLASMEGDPAAWRSLRRGGRRLWDYGDVRRTAEAILRALPEVAIKLFREGSFSGQAIVNLPNILSTPTVADVRRNFLWLKVVVQLFPDVCPTTFFYADVFVELNKLLEHKMLVPKALPVRSVRRGRTGEAMGGSLGPSWVARPSRHGPPALPWPCRDSRPLLALPRSCPPSPRGRATFACPIANAACMPPGLAGRRLPRRQSRGSRCSKARNSTKCTATSVG